MGVDCVKPQRPVAEARQDQEGKDEGQRARPQHQVIIVWGNVIKFIILHLLAVNGLFSLVVEAKWFTVIIFVLFSILSGLGITAGAHRLWAHRSYKATLPLRLFLVAANCVSMQNSIYVWARDHRVHHKFSETDADPHNAKRGFFFAHMGWLMVKKHPDVIQYGAKIDLSDLENDKLVMFQHNHYIPLSLTLNILLPTLLPWYFWDESLWVAYVCVVFRYVITLHFTWFVNSAAHLWGDRPYDVSINPSENMMVSVLTMGEGFHNFHHVFPQDYSVSEWGYTLNLTTVFIDLMAWLGLAHSRKKMSAEVIQNRIARTGPNAKERDTVTNFDY